MGFSDGVRRDEPNYVSIHVSVHLESYQSLYPLWSRGVLQGPHKLYSYAARVAHVGHKMIAYTIRTRTLPYVCCNLATRAA